MNYLRYIEHSAENLQFFLWFRDYSARWAQLPASEKALSPEWSREQAETAFAANAPVRPKRENADVTAALKDTDFTDGSKVYVADKTDPFGTPSKSSEDEKMRDHMSDHGSSNVQTLGYSTHESIADQAFQDAGLKWKPCKSPAIFASAKAVSTNNLAQSPRNPTATRSSV